MAATMSDDNCTTTIQELGSETDSNLESNPESEIRSEMSSSNSNKVETTTIVGGPIINPSTTAQSILSQRNTHMKNGLKFALVKPFCLEKIVELQKDSVINQLAPLNPENDKSSKQLLEGLKCLVEKYPKELLICTSCLTVVFGFLFVCNSNNLLVIIVVIGICYLASSYLDKWSKIQITSSRDQVKNRQLNLAKQLDVVHYEKVKTLGEQSVKVDEGRNKTAAEITKLEKEIKTEEFRATNRNHEIDARGRARLKSLEVNGKKILAEIAKKQAENLAKINVETSNYVAKMEYELKKMELENMGGSGERPEVEAENDEPERERGGPCRIV